MILTFHWHAIHEMLTCASTWCTVGIKKVESIGFGAVIVDDGTH